jgi:folate-binding protein YgfZ
MMPSPLRGGLVIADRSARAFVGVRGRDAAKLLQSLVSNDIDALAVGSSQLAFVLTPKGRPVADLRIWREADDAFVLEAEPELQDVVAAVVRRYRLAARAEVADDRGRVGLVAVGGEIDAPEGTLAAGGVLGTDVLGPVDTVRELRERLVAAGARPIDAAAYERARIEAGAPRFGAEIDESVLPAETGIVDQAISFTKGCYVGQEPVARLHYRGHPNRHLRRLHSLAGALPSLPADLVLGDRVVGRLTSVSEPDGIALGYVRREIDEGAIVEVRPAEGSPVQARVENRLPASMAPRRP